MFFFKKLLNNINFIIDGSDKSAVTWIIPRTPGDWVHDRIGCRVGVISYIKFFYTDAVVVGVAVAHRVDLPPENIEVLIPATIFGNCEHRPIT